MGKKKEAVATWLSRGTGEDTAQCSNFNQNFGFVGDIQYLLSFIIGSQ